LVNISESFYKEQEKKWKQSRKPIRQSVDFPIFIPEEEQLPLSASKNCFHARSPLDGFLLSLHDCY